MPLVHLAMCSRPRLSWVTELAWAQRDAYTHRHKTVIHGHWTPCQWIRMLDLWHWKDSFFTDIGLKNTLFWQRRGVFFFFFFFWGGGGCCYKCTLYSIKVVDIGKSPFVDKCRRSILSDPYFYKMHPIWRFHGCWPAKSTLIDDFNVVTSKK